MKRHLTFLLMALHCIALHSSSFESKQLETPRVKTQQTETILLWDLGGIHWNLSHMKFGFETAKNIGFSTLAPLLVIDHKVPGSSIIFDTLRQFPAQPEPGFQHTFSSSGTELPYVLCAYQAGRVTSKDVLKMAKEVLPELRLKGHFVSQRHHDAVQRSIETIFNPETHARLTNLLTEGIDILREIDALKKAGMKIKQVALSNWDPESFALVKARFPEEMALFDDIIISGDIHTIKPNEAAFEAVFKRHGYNKNKYVFIDDQKENVKAAEQFGIENSLLFTAGDYYTLRKHLYTLGILPQMPAQKILTTNVKIAAICALAGAVLLWCS